VRVELIVGMSWCDERRSEGAVDGVVGRRRETKSRRSRVLVLLVAGTRYVSRALLRPQVLGNALYKR
jgi:hypothetical protein